MYKKFIKTVDKSSTLSSIAATICATIIMAIFNIELFKKALNFKIPIWLILLILGGYFLKGKLQSKTNSAINGNVLDKKISITFDEETNLDNITLSKDVLCYSKDVFQDPISKSDIVFTWNYSINNEGAYPVNIQFLCPYCNRPMREYTSADNDPYCWIKTDEDEINLACHSCLEHFELDYTLQGVEPPSKEVWFSYKKNYYYNMRKKIEYDIHTKISKLKN